MSVAQQLIDPDLSSPCKCNKVLRTRCLTLSCLLATKDAGDMWNLRCIVLCKPGKVFPWKCWMQPQTVAMHNHRYISDHGTVGYALHGGCIMARAHERTQPHARCPPAHPHARMHARTPARPRTHACRQARTHAHARMHTHILFCLLLSSSSWGFRWHFRTTIV